jgi:hypothetical protein
MTFWFLNIELTLLIQRLSDRDAAEILATNVILSGAKNLAAYKINPL